jgi:hypothetical protein
MGKFMTKIAIFGIKKAGISSYFLGKLHDFKENSNWEEAFYRPLLYKMENH